MLEVFRIENAAARFKCRSNHQAVIKAELVAILQGDRMLQQCAARQHGTDRLQVSRGKIQGVRRSDLLLELPRYGIQEFLNNLPADHRTVLRQQLLDQADGCVALADVRRIQRIRE